MVTESKSKQITRREREREGGAAHLTKSTLCKIDII